MNREHGDAGSTGSFAEQKCLSKGKIKKFAGIQVYFGDLCKSRKLSLIAERIIIDYYSWRPSRFPRKNPNTELERVVEKCKVVSLEGHAWKGSIAQPRTPLSNVSRPGTSAKIVIFAPRSPIKINENRDFRRKTTNSLTWFEDFMNFPLDSIFSFL